VQKCLDWSGPFAVSDSKGEATMVGTMSSASLYDPADTCVICEEVTGQGQNVPTWE